MTIIKENQCIDLIQFPSIRAISDCTPSTGTGWFQLDKWEAWDGIPSEIPEVSTITGLTITGGSVQ